MHRMPLVTSRLTCANNGIALLFHAIYKNSLYYLVRVVLVFVYFFIFFGSGITESLSLWARGGPRRGGGGGGGGVTMGVGGMGCFLGLYFFRCLFSFYFFFQ